MEPATLAGDEFENTADRKFRASAEEMVDALREILYGDREAVGQLDSGEGQSWPKGSYLDLPSQGRSARETRGQRPMVRWHSVPTVFCSVK